MIHKANELGQAKRFRALIGGVPGIGKTTLGLSAPAPLLIDCDRGLDRVEARFRTGAFIQPEKYEDVLSDLTVENLAPFQSIVIDTGGALLDLMKSWAIRQNPKNGQKDGMTLSMVGYGAIGHEFKRFMDLAFYTLQKNVIVLFHVKEDADGDTKVYRLDVEGQTRSNIWKPMDLGGFMEAVRDKRTIGFSPTDRYFAKGTHGIEGTMEIPNLKGTTANTFLADLFARVSLNIQAETAVNTEYDLTMNTIRALVDAVKDEATAKDALEEFKIIKHVYSSKDEAWSLLKHKAEAVGMKWDSVAKRFTK